jgi:transcription antitermination factor NusG
MDNWHIWVIKINKFDDVETYLKTLPEIEEFLYPTATKEYKLKSGEIKKKRVPLYSGYLFLKYKDSPETYTKLSSYPFITTYVGVCTGKDLELVRQVRELELLNTTNKNMQVDDMVRINTGPFKGFEGAVTSVTSSNIIVQISVFGRSVNTTFSKDDADIIERPDK